VSPQIRHTAIDPTSVKKFCSFHSLLNILHSCLFFITSLHSFCRINCSHLLRKNIYIISSCL
jgi:hypothetical protein